jgi:uncharacterized coiled-coil protein SlyX
MSKEMEQRISDLEQQLASRERELDAMKAKSAQMEKVLSELRATVLTVQLEQASGSERRTAETTVPSEQKILRGIARRTPEVHKAGADPGSAVERAEGLFYDLLSTPKLISYSDAYRAILGPYDIWRNAVHPAKIIEIALQTKPRSVGTLTIRLDALIVGKSTLRPAKGHFRNAGYSESDWIRTFGGWPLVH